MSSGAQNTRAELLSDLARELREFTGLGASLFRVAAARIGMTATDLQVMDWLDASGPMTAGQLADLTGLTTGAITGLLNRLEEAGLVRRERDPEDGRRVIVHLTRGEDQPQQVGSVVPSIGKAWEELTAQYTDEQIAFLLEFLTRSNALAQSEIVRLREAPERESEGGILSAPLGEVAVGRLVISAGTSRLAVHAGRDMAALYQARFAGSAPEVKVTDGEVAIRYPRRLWGLGGPQRAAEVTLNAAIPWRIAIQAKAAAVTAELRDLDLADLDVKGDASMIRLDVPMPSGVVPIRINGGVSDVTIRRPEGVAAQVRLKGRASVLVFDDERYTDARNNVRLQSSGYQTADRRYDIEVASSASKVTITTI